MPTSTRALSTHEDVHRSAYCLVGVYIDMMMAGMGEAASQGNSMMLQAGSLPKSILR